MTESSTEPRTPTTPRPAGPPLPDRADPDRRIGLVVLDMAGTTVADDGLVERAFAAAARAAGVEPGTERHARMLDHVRATMGESKITVFRALFTDEATALRANAAFERAYDALVREGHRAAVPGAEETVRRLRAQGRVVVLSTGFSRETRKTILEALGWDQLVDLALSPADAGRGRPHPDMVLAALLRTGAADSVAQVAVVGDTASDMLAGRRAGAGVVAGVLSGAHDSRRLRDAGATHTLPSVADLPGLLAEEEL